MTVCQTIVWHPNYLPSVWSVTIYWYGACGRKRKQGSIILKHIRHSVWMIILKDEFRNHLDKMMTLSKTPYQDTVHLNNLTTAHSTHTPTRLKALCPGLPGWAGTRKVKPIWILLKQETLSGSGISWAVCKSAPRTRQITTPAPTTQFFTGRMPFLPPNQQRQSTEGKNLTTAQLK